MYKQNICAYFKFRIYLFSVCVCVGALNVISFFFRMGKVLTFHTMMLLPVGYYVHRRVSLTRTNTPADFINVK